MDLSTLTTAELRELQKRIPVEMKRREAQEKIAVLNELKAFAEARGYSIDQLLAKDSPKTRVRGTVRIKYRHPKNNELTWTGRGRTPRWVVEWQAGGGSLDHLLV